MLLYITLMKNSHICIFVCAHQHTLAYKFTYCSCDMHMLCIPYKYCIMMLFAETVLRVGQVLMLVQY